MPLVSVITPFFNAEQFLSEAIESLFAQSYTEWELLLLDDGSDDASLHIAQEYSARDPQRVRCLHHEGHRNLGQAISSNVAIEQARGKYVAFLDADDVWVASKLADQVAILEKNPGVGMVYGPGMVWYSWTGRPEDAGKDFVTRAPDLENRIVLPPALAVRCYPLGKQFGPHPSSVMLRRELLERIGAFDSDSPQLYLDQSLFAKVYVSSPVFVSDKCWHKYRQHPESCCSQMRDSYHSVRLRFLRWLEQYYRENGIRDGAVWRAWRKAIWPYNHPLLYKRLKPVLVAARKTKSLLIKPAKTWPQPESRE